MRLPSDADLAWVRRFRRSVAARIDDLTAIAGDELGRDPFETVTSDIVPLLSACRWTEKHTRRVLRPRRVRGKSIWQLGQRHRAVRAPLGRVGIIATWNYPIQLMGVQLVHAIVAGNRVVVKPSERTPRTQALVLDLAREAGLSADRLSWTDATREAGEAMLREGSFDHVVFTGSTEVGRAIAGTLAETLTPSTLELSGCDSAVVLRDADPKLAARSIAYALTLNGGRTCMAPRRAIVSEGVLDAFVAELATALDARREQIAPGTDGPELARAHALLEESGARAIGSGWARAGVGCESDSSLARGEHFGPVLAIVGVSSDGAAIELAKSYPQRLATAVFTRSRRRIDASDLGSGIVTINDCVIPTGHPGVSLGGTGPSGWGVTRGEAGLLAMTRGVNVSVTSGRIRTPTDPPSDAVAGRVTRFVRAWYGR
ncbi:MAG: aldehyde dehydrogenase family protein [Phycisphaerales bacterium]